MKKMLCEIHRVGNESFWFCLECLNQNRDPGDPSWLEMSETGVSDSFFSLELDRTLNHLSEVHRYPRTDIEITDKAIFRL
ncbi:MAG: hypothetical protein ACE5GH_00770 [Fidelibacterota bacterium]